MTARPVSWRKRRRRCLNIQMVTTVSISKNVYSRRFRLSRRCVLRAFSSYSLSWDWPTISVPPSLMSSQKLPSQSRSLEELFDRSRGAIADRMESRGEYVGGSTTVVVYDIGSHLAFDGGTGNAKRNVCTFCAMSFTCQRKAVG